MHIVDIPKPDGSTRRIYVPSRGERRALRKLLPDLQHAAESADVYDVAHGFRRGRNPVTNAARHTGRAYSVCLDLRDFFASVTPEHMPDDLGIDVSACFIDGAARQGLPTSPVIANIAAAPMDAAINEWIGDRDITYTRYADDLTFSFDDPALIPDTLDNIPAIAKRFGFTAKRSKTHVQDARHGRRMITGVAVGDDLRPSRRLKRQLRAALHQGRTPQARGLAEAAKLKTPCGVDRAYRSRLRRIAFVATKLRLPPSEQIQRAAVAAR